MRCMFLAIVLGVLSCSSEKTAVSNDAAAQTATTVPASPIERCINLGSALEAPNEGEWGYTIRAVDMQRIADAGFDTVRIPIKWSAHTENVPPYTIDRSFMARIDDVLTAALMADLQVIINVHHYDELNAKLTPHKERLYAMWDQIAYHYQDVGDRLIFEVLNEPHSKMTFEEVDTVNRRVLDRIRQVSPDRWVIYATGQWANPIGLYKSKPYLAPRTILSFHYYGPFEFTHQGATWTEKPYPIGVSWGTPEQYATIEKDFATVRAKMAPYGLPIFLGEFGAYDPAPAFERAKWTEHVRKTAEANGFSWCHWSYTSGFEVFSKKDQAWIPEMKDALITPFRR